MPLDGPTPTNSALSQRLWASFRKLNPPASCPSPCCLPANQFFVVCYTLSFGSPKLRRTEVLVNACISAVQRLRPLRGGAQSHLLRATDGASYVTKFQNNPQHIRVLANEMLATNLGLALGLPMPRVEVIEVSDWLIEHTEDLRLSPGGVKIACRSCEQFGSLYVGARVLA